MRHLNDISPELAEKRRRRAAASRKRIAQRGLQTHRQRQATEGPKGA